MRNLNLTISKQCFKWMSTLILLASCFGFTQSALASDVCDRACLENHINTYLTALLNHDPRDLRLTLDAKFTENGQELRLGDGFWGTVSGMGTYKLYMADVESGQAAFFGTLYENGLPVALTLRLKVDEQLISEIETLVVRRAGANSDLPTAVLLEEIGAPRPQFFQTVPEAQRMSREDLQITANKYFVGLANNTGNNSAPFKDSCIRIENGNATITDSPLASEIDFEVRDYNDTALLGCQGQQDSGILAFVTEVRNRRFPLIDRERGLVLAFAFFEHSGTIKEITLKNGNKVDSPVIVPTTIQVAELFQIRDFEIDQVEALIIDVPYGMKSRVWDE